MTFSKCWCHYTTNIHIEHNSQAEYEKSMNLPIAVKKEQFITSLDGEVQNPNQEIKLRDDSRTNLDMRFSLFRIQQSCA
jgi:hypothetical protein